MPVISLIGIIVAVAFMIIFAFRGFPAVILAPVCAIIVLIFGGQNILEGMTNTYMGGFASFMQRFFLVFFVGSVYGSIMGDSGAAKSIGIKFARIAQRSKSNAKLFTIFAIIAISTILAYGGISNFVIMFTVLAIAKELYYEMDVPWRLFGCQVVGSGCLAMTMLPGSPSTPNVVASAALGTTPMAAPTLGIIAVIIELVLSTIYIKWELGRAKKNNEGFLPTGTDIGQTGMEKDEDFKELNIVACLAPSIVLLVVLNVFKQHIVVCTLLAIALAFILYWRRWENKLKTVMNGANIAINASVLVSLCTALGTVITATEGFQFIISAIEKIPGTPLIQLIVAVNLMAAFSGSSAGGLTVALDVLGERFIATGINPQVLHRISTISCGGLGFLPHNGSVINELNVAKLKHKDAYMPYLICALLIPIITAFILAGLAQLGIV